MNFIKNCTLFAVIFTMTNGCYAQPHYKNNHKNNNGNMHHTKYQKKELYHKTKWEQRITSKNQPTPQKAHPSTSPQPTEQSSCNDFSPINAPCLLLMLFPIIANATPSQAFDTNFEQQDTLVFKKYKNCFCKNYSQPTQVTFLPASAGAYAFEQCFCLENNNKKVKTAEAIPTALFHKYSGIIAKKVGMYFIKILFVSPIVGGIMLAKNKCMPIIIAAKNMLFQTNTTITAPAKKITLQISTPAAFDFGPSKIVDLADQEACKAL